MSDMKHNVTILEREDKSDKIGKVKVSPPIAMSDGQQVEWFAFFRQDYTTKAATAADTCARPGATVQIQLQFKDGRDGYAGEWMIQECVPIGAAPVQPAPQSPAPTPSAVAAQAKAQDVQPAALSPKDRQIVSQSQMQRAVEVWQTFAQLGWIGEDADHMNTICKWHSDLYDQVVSKSS